MSKAQKNNEPRHAYLVLAHKNDYAFKTLIKMLDDPQNDIFIHMDAKNKSYNTSDIEKLTKKSQIYHCKRTKVTWGAYNTINAELLLLKTATSKTDYSYYHLISGQDLPIKKQSEIHDFFNKHQGKEFVRFQNPVFSYGERIRYYYPLQKFSRKNPPLYIRAFDKVSLKTQKLLHIQRNKNIAFQKGDNWFSITDDLARYVVKKEPWIFKTFKNTYCCDEVFLQTVIINSKYKERLFNNEYDNNPLAFMRLIDWQRGNPYIFKETDFKEIKHSKYLFARKFDHNVDKKIIDKLYELYYQ